MSDKTSVVYHNHHYCIIRVQRWNAELSYCYFCIHGQPYLAHAHDLRHLCAYTLQAHGQLHSRSYGVMHGRQITTPLTRYLPRPVHERPPVCHRERVSPRTCRCGRALGQCSSTCRQHALIMRRISYLTLYLGQPPLHTHRQ